ncbi:MAG: aldo/keto reductase, partial [Steroidobacteraceae bacterium]
PGTTKRHRLEENLGSVNIELSAADLQEINAAAAGVQIQGERLPASMLKMTGL